MPKQRTQHATTTGESSDDVVQQDAHNAPHAQEDASPSSTVHADNRINPESDNPHTPPKTYLKQLLAPYRSRMMLALMLALISVLVFIVQSYLLALLFADWLNAASSQQVIDATLAWHVLPWLAACWVVRPVLALIKAQYLLTTSLRIRHDVRKRLLQALVSLGPARRHIANDGALSTHVLEQVDELDGYISRFYVQRYVAVLTPLFIVIATFFFSPLAAVLMLLTAPLVPVFMILVGSAAAEKSQAQFVAMSRLSGRFLDLLRGMPTLKRLQATSQALATIRHASADYQTRTMSVLRLAFLSGAVLELFASLAIALVALYLGLGLLGILPWAKGHIPVAYQGALFILLLAPEFYAPLRQLGSDYHAKAKAEAAVESFMPLLDVIPMHVSQHTLHDKHHLTDTSASVPSAHHTVPAWHTAPALSVRQLHMVSYEQPVSDPTEDNAPHRHYRLRLAPLDVEVAAGERIALVGDSGSGKSSFLEALLGFAAFEGHVHINNTPYTRDDLTQIRHHVGYMAQHAAFLPLSIADNLRLAKDDASDAELIQVLTHVDLWELIGQLPDGLHTVLGERGDGLSGGQQQRLALAQLLLRDTPLWLLDEPCAHLDSETAQHIYHLLGRLSENKTVILISHDLSQVNWIDRQVHIPMPDTHQQGGNHA